MQDLRKTIRKLIQEAISLDVKPGDVILTGRFKNKRRIVKTIGTDRFGQPTINGKSILKFKIEKKMPKKKWSAKSRAELKEVRQLVRNILQEESACDSINDKVSTGIKEIAMQKCTVEIYNDGDDKFIAIVGLARSSKAIIELGDKWTPMSEDPEYAPCHGAWIVLWSSVNGLEGRGKGVGALLYDIAIETAGSRGLTSDRDSVSAEAFPMWNYYYNNPAVYDKKLIDPLNPNTGEGRWTDDPNDDCVSRSWMKAPEKLTRSPEASSMNDGFMEEHKEEYMNNPLNYVYIKKDQSQPTIHCLTEMGLMK